MMTERAAEQRLSGAVARWNVETGYGLADVIQAARTALTAGLYSPTLRELAGVKEKDPSGYVRALAGQALEELGIAQLETVGGGARRPDVDTLRLEVAPMSGFHLLVHVNDVEMTAAGAGLGMDPYDVLIPTNRLIATVEPRTVPIARCTCGEYGCGSTDVVITRDGDLVHWDWLLEVPMRRGVSFAAAQYDDEVDRVAADHSWETPERTAGRQVLTNLDRDRLHANGLSPSWVANDYRDPEQFQVALRLGDDYQVFVEIPWGGRGPEQLAREVCRILALPPDQWHAGWHAIKPALTRPPAIAGPSWHRKRF